MEEKRYPIIEEEDGVGMCCEPPVGYAATGSGYINTLSDDDCMLPDNYDPGIGPYTMEELNARIDEAELAIERAENGDESDWVTAEEMDAELFRMFPWTVVNSYLKLEEEDGMLKAAEDKKSSTRKLGTQRSLTVVHYFSSGLSRRCLTLFHQRMIREFVGLVL